jgi:hypothetical protein
MNILNNRITDLRIQFKGHLRPFKVTTYLCDSSDCPCTNATLEFTEIEVDGSAVARPIHFSFDVDIITWQKRENTNHSEQINALIDEFLHNIPDETKVLFKQARDQRAERKHKLATFSMPAEDIRKGILVSFSEIMANPDDYNGFPAHGFTFTAHDQTYYIDDLYCSNPKCDCKNVNLCFLKSNPAPDGKITLTEAFFATLSLGGRNLTFSRLGDYSQSQAYNMVCQWLKNSPDVIPVFRPRYKDIRKATKRILKTSRNSSKNTNTPPPLFVRITNKSISQPTKIEADRLLSATSPNKTSAPVGKVGRNDPCPCGSGKKYKKCCANRKLQ